jgi:predicted nucleic acid-binding protein
MLIAACKEAGVDVLYSEDMDDGADYDGVRIENPFA